MSTRLVFACAAALSLLGQSANAQAQIALANGAALPQISRPLIVDRTLATNDQNAARHITLAGEDEGIAHIRRLLGTSTVEEQWAFLPDQRMWIEIGVGEDKAQVETDVEYLKLILFGAPRVHLYHFHPARYFEPGVNASLALALPSPADVESSVKIAMLMEEANLATDVRNYVVSPHGVVEYEPTSIGSARMHAEATHPRAFVARDLLTLVTLRRSAFNLERMLDATPNASATEIIHELCSQLSSEFYRMEFYPNVS